MRLSASDKYSHVYCLATHGSPKFTPVAPVDQNKVSTPKLKCEALEIRVIFINLYYVLSCNLDRAVPAADPLLPRITSSDNLWYVCGVINIFEA